MCVLEPGSQEEGDAYWVVDNVVCSDEQSAHDCTSFSDEGHIPQLQDNSMGKHVSEL